MISDKNVNKPIVGYYFLEGNKDGSKLGLTKKPIWFRRIFIFIFLGWNWIDINKK
jgi:hypothetical protein